MVRGLESALKQFYLCTWHIAIFDNFITALMMDKIFMIERIRMHNEALANMVKFFKFKNNESGIFNNVEDMEQFSDSLELLNFLLRLVAEKLIFPS